MCVSTWRQLLVLEDYFALPWLNTGRRHAEFRKRFSRRQIRLALRTEVRVHSSTWVFLNARPSFHFGLETGEPQPGDASSQR
jgi:hypothetical protein